MTTRPTARPAAASMGVNELQPDKAATKPPTVMVPVRTFGIRRTRRSTAVLRAPAAAIAETVRGSEILSNGHPEHVVNLFADGGHRAHREDRDQRREQPVFEQILAIALAHEPCDGGNYLLHGTPHC